MSDRASDEQIAEWQEHPNWFGQHILDALKAEQAELIATQGALEGATAQVRADRVRLTETRSRVAFVEGERDYWKRRFAEERARADAAEKVTAEVLSLNGDIAYELMDTHRIIGVLWKSRRMWQQEVEVTRGALRIYRALMELAEGHLEKIRALHRQDGKYCICEEMWPCQTVEILSGKS